MYEQQVVLDLGNLTVSAEDILRHAQVSCVVLSSEPYRKFSETYIVYLLTNAFQNCGHDICERSTVEQQRGKMTKQPVSD
jgi:hypothetical protein